MAVMSPQPPVSAHDQKVSSAAPVPASAGAGTMASDEAMGMDLDNSGTSKPNESSVRPDYAPSSPQEDHSKPAATHSLFVNGNKGITAPPSPPIPTPPLQHLGDIQDHDLSDLRITSPDGSILHSGTFDRVIEDLPMGGSHETAEGQTSTEAKTDSKTDSPPPPPPPPPPPAQAPSAPDSDHTMHDAPPPKKNGRDREEDDDGEDRPPKRAKTEDMTESKAGTSSASTSTDLSGPMTPARAKFCLSVVRSLRRSKDGRPFSMPVDVEKLNIPTYYTIVKRPMDLQSMEKRLNGSEEPYKDVETFVNDFKQILFNCVTFNGPEHIVTTMSRSMEGAFYRQMKDLPGEHVVEVEKPKTQKKKGHVLSGAAAASHQNKASGVSTTKVTAKANAKNNRKKETAKPTPAQSPLATSPVFSLQPSGMPQIRRDSTAGDGRPKREIHPPAPKDLPYSTKPRRKHNVAELKFCESVLKELNKKVHEPYAFPFYHPVDPVALNIPDYFKIIKKPMDLSTMQEKLKLNNYENAAEFEVDMRLMFNNCYKFNPESQPVHQMGRRLESVFDQKWKEKPMFLSKNQGSRSPQSASPIPHADEEMSEEEEEVANDSQHNIAELEKQLEKMKEEISLMKKGQQGKKSKTPPAAPPAKVPKQKPAPTTTKKAPAAPRAPATGGSRGGRKKGEIPYISLEQKTELSERINLLPPGKMHYALVMIKEMMPELGNDGAEIELDIDELDPHTLHKLYKYVSKNAPEIPRTYVPPPPPPTEHLYESKAKSKPGSKGRKNKPMSAAEQEAKIKDIESRLQNFENPGAYTPAAPVPNNHPDSDSSDDDESSGSESEEE